MTGELENAYFAKDLGIILQFGDPEDSESESLLSFAGVAIEDIHPEGTGENDGVPVLTAALLKAGVEMDDSYVWATVNLGAATVEEVSPRDFERYVEPPQEHLDAFDTES